ncbi:hypothetical protein OGAPHI_002941 [Ogataea philodendri]|uniref:Uncharacterized protein n=1 Tax=Ogataea philodendri TaxID=1378263 RepID=A0A9P8P8H5_9ASCO|nr:uncharacterized protein OGAPHI_002941 [Ogataea philodendri]KAH3667292.1 hypothetical protein OGAPHI_002941 [Ogataea philodendri]
MYCWVHEEVTLGGALDVYDVDSEFDWKSVMSKDSGGSDPFADPDGEELWESHCAVNRKMDRWAGRSCVALFGQMCLGVVVGVAVRHSLTD